MKSFIKRHPYLFFSIIGGIIIITVVVVVICVTLTDRDEKTEEQEEGEEIEEIPIFPFEDNSKSKVIEIYNEIDTGNKDKGTLEQFLQYISEKGSDLKDEEKVYLAHYWITHKISYDDGALQSRVNPEDVFLNKKAVCSGYSRLFKQILLEMNYPSSKIKNIVGIGKGVGYTPFSPQTENHEWNAVEINGKWCLIDTTWDAVSYLKDEFYLCTPPKCFARDHFPTIDDQSLQFLKNPISLETFHGLVQNKKGICTYNIEVTEDKAIQNICGRGSVLIKYKIKEDDFAIGLNIQSSEIRSKNPEYFITKIENGYKIDLSINEIGLYGFYFSIKFNSGDKDMGNIYFQCNEEPDEKTYYPTLHYFYQNSDSQLISPIQRDLIKGQRYTFEVRTSDFNQLILTLDKEKIPMTKNGDIYREENVFVHGNSISITADNYYFISFKGIGDDVGYPEFIENRYINIEYRLLQPLISTLTKGVEYTFEIRCYRDNEIFKIKYGTNNIEMDRKNNAYTKKITIDSSSSENELYIVYDEPYGENYLHYNLFKYILI